MLEQVFLPLWTSPLQHAGSRTSIQAYGAKVKAPECSLVGNLCPSCVWRHKHTKAHLTKRQDTEAVLLLLTKALLLPITAGYQSRQQQVPSPAEAEKSGVFPLPPQGWR